MGAGFSMSGGDEDDTTVITGSASSVPKLSGTHEFTIRDYSRTKGMGIGKSILSQNFTVDGRTWYIRFYPDGYMAANAECVSVYLQTLYRPQFCTVRAEFSIELIGGPNGGNTVYMRRSHRACKFNTFCNSWGFRSFITRQQLESAALGAVQTDSITIRCTVAVLKDQRRSRPHPRPGHVAVPPPPPSCHGQNAMRFLASGKAPFDVRFNVDGVVLEAHRLVVAGQSPWFEALLYGNGSEAGSDVVDIGDASPAAFGGVLHFIYNDELPPETAKGRRSAYELTKELFVAADTYLMERMKKMCASRLCDYIKRDTAEDIMELAEAHSCKELERACRSFLARNGVCRPSPA